ncbi:casein kinase II regulatory subunit-domain-containing protein [Tuber brumale]|nr:casein kinase II regulatory subunit-domain-containing protein [Tuber brumale]
MPPTPPPTSTDNNREQLGLNYPDARHYQPLPDSPDSPPTPPPQSEARKQQRHQQSQSNLLGHSTNLHSSPDHKQGPVRERVGSVRVEGSEVPPSSATGEAFVAEDPTHSGSDLLLPEDGDGHSRTYTRAASAVATASTSATTTTVTTPYTCPPIIPGLLGEDDGEDNDEFYNLAALRSAGLYRRSGALDKQARGQIPTGLVRREIGIVKRDEFRDYVRRDGDNSSSAALGSGRLKNVELAGRYAQTRSPPQHPTSTTLQTSSVHSHSSGQSASEEEEISEVEEEEEEEEEEEDDMEEEESWIGNFCSMLGHEYFAEVTEDFIEDDFNLTGLGQMVPMYKEALEMILDVEPEDDSDSQGSASESLSEQTGAQGGAYRRRSAHIRVASDLSVIESSAELLYGLIHQRFITSRQGIQMMYDKYLANHFGFCPRVYCTQARVLPCGYSDTPGVETVKLFCPSCCDIYVPPNSRFQTVDGAYFGTTFASLFLMTFPELDTSGNGRKEVLSGTSLNSVGGKKGVSQASAPSINGVLAANLAPGLGRGKQYEMRIYGFRVSERARSGPRMGWLRSRPEDVSLLDETAKSGAAADEEVEYSSEEEGLEDSEGEEESADEDEMVLGGDSVVGSRLGTSRRGGITPMDTNGTGIAR